MRILLLLLLPFAAFSQINTEQIDIVRDSFGVPHIFAPTDEQVAYGLAWATAEDDFITIQQQLLPIKGLSGQVNGKSGAFFDVAVHLLDADQIVAERYEIDLSPKFRAILEAYTSGINKYAAMHPKEVVHKKLFPASPKDIVKAYVVGMALLSHVDAPLVKILEERLDEADLPETRGSNAFAINKNKSIDGNTYIALNSHQPLEGLNSWYEAHLCSEEGWNILGSNFAGGVSIFQGTNEHLSWAHTVNHADFADVFQLEMHPDDPMKYKFDDQWLTLSPYHTKAKIKLLGFIPFSLKQKFYKSVYGVTFKTDQGVFSLRASANKTIQTAEQWYRMNKAQNFDEFKEALTMRGVSCTNIVYADQESNIYYISNGLLPVRSKEYDWTKVVPGNTSQTLWTDFYPIDSLPQVYNPASGYVYNCNHSPFLSSAPADNPREDEVPFTTGYQSKDILTNRGERFYTLIKDMDKLSYEDFKYIRKDRYFEKPMDSAPKLEAIFHLDESKRADLAKSIQLLREWDRSFDEESTEASIMILALKYIFKEVKGEDILREGDALNEEELFNALEFAETHLIKHFGRKEVALQELQIHSRADVFLPFAGGPDVMAAVYSNIQENGTVRPVAGDSYIQLVQWTKDGPIIESVNAYGAANVAGHPHSTDQMELFVKQELKPMTLDKDIIYQNAEAIYHPK